MVITASTETTFDAFINDFSRVSLKVNGKAICETGQIKLISLLSPLKAKFIM